MRNQKFAMRLVIFWYLNILASQGAPEPPKGSAYTRVSHCSLKHKVGSCLFGSTGGLGGCELSAVVKIYPDTQI